ncbi:MAG: hypothetical protein HOP33_07130 [Verrucomicrobia bacterium]|nr:hypothetical protein [Verrucomicrobiota bacterium]
MTLSQSAGSGRKFGNCCAPPLR